LPARYTQGIAAFARITSKALVNSRWNKVVNIASTKMMKKIARWIDQEQLIAKI
jgi:hypothetical protein